MAIQVKVVKGKYAEVMGTVVRDMSRFEVAVALTRTMHCCGIGQRVYDAMILTSDGVWIVPVENYHFEVSVVAELAAQPCEDLARKRPGVYFNKKAQRWQAQHRKEGKTVYIGQYDTFEKAVAARLAAVEKAR